ncbi:winged helix-turn-helix transcriptional regulator [Pediococcus acidilactici]|uniref:winged helix-turn-helix transcriptional regulator n=1 Tax=Pediococcus acidilactici TaxID=1254 RepID=UPI00137BD78D|nr:helix-turn-helix domain-containing protein [Pediococcus acidilactici]QHS02941.1 helix-turn-helix transcriptional regulator [Pediococcus acidilactici]
MKRHVYNCYEGCPIESTLQIISGKWKSVIIYHLLKNDVCRFGQLQKWMNGCSRRMLALQLQELESDGVIEKKIYPVIPVKTEYRLTEYGNTLSPIILAMESWGKTYNAIHSDESQTMID